MKQYFIIGGDGREYGPASVDDLRQWVAERRANGRSKVRREGEGVWIPMGEMPELTDTLAATGQRETNQPVVPPPAPGPGEELAEVVLGQDPRLDIGDCFARGWDLLMGGPGLLIGATALVALLLFGVGSIPVVGLAAALAFVFVMLGGLYLVFLRRLRGEPADIGLAFAGFSGSLFVPLLLAGVIASSLSFVGLILCVVPGVYLIVCWAMYAPLLIADKGLDFWQALECSRRVVTRLWWPHFGLFLLALCVIGAGLLFCGVGVILTLPLAIAAVVVAYEETFAKGEDQPTPKPELPPQPDRPAPSSETAESAVSEPTDGSVKREEPAPSAVEPPALISSPGDATSDSASPKAPISNTLSARPKRVVLRGVPTDAPSNPKRVRKATAAPPRPPQPGKT